jgi:hypothetical protein
MEIQDLMQQVTSILQIIIKTIFLRINKDVI